MTETEKANFRDKIDTAARYSQVLDRVFRSALPRNNANQVVITLNTGNIYNFDISGSNDDLPSHYLNAIARSTEIRVVSDDGETDWVGSLESISDYEEGSAVLQVEFLPDNRTGTFTDAEGITVYFGYAPVNERIDDETITRDGNGAIQVGEIDDQNIKDDMTDSEKSEFRSRIGAEGAIPMARWYGVGQTEALPDTLGSGDAVTTPYVKAFTGGDADDSLNGGVAVTWSNINDETDADDDAQSDLDNTVFAITDAGRYHITIHFRGNQDQTTLGVAALLFKIVSGTDDAVIINQNGYARGYGTITDTSINNQIKDKEEYINISAGDKFYLRFYGGIVPPGDRLNRNRVAGYIQLEKVA